MKKIFETQDMNKAAILATIEGVKIGLLTVDLVDGKHIVTYRNEYSSSLQPIVDDSLKRYEDRTLMIDANQLCYRLTFLRSIHSQKVKQFKSKH
jgi:hypothetical protein